MTHLLHMHSQLVQNPKTLHRVGQQYISMCVAIVALSVAAGCAGTDAGTKSTTGDLSGVGGSNTILGSGGQHDGSGGNAAQGSGSTGNDSSGGDGSLASGGGGSGGSNSTSGNDGSGGRTSVVEGSEGCGLPAPFTDKQTVVQNVDGTDRSYIVIPPDNYNPNQAYALVVGFHGAGGMAENMVGGLGGMREYTKEQAFYLFPNSDSEYWDYRGRDLALLDAASDKAFAEWCIDTSQVFVVGFSDGGWMAAQAACERSDLLHAVAIFSGGGPMAKQQCGASIPLMIAHGGDSDSWSYQSQSLFDFYPGKANCDVQAPLVATDSSACQAYVGCDAGGEVWSCLHDEGHDIPNFADTDVWDFFSTH